MIIVKYSIQNVLFLKNPSLNFVMKKLEVTENINENNSKHLFQRNYPKLYNRYEELEIKVISDLLPFVQLPDYTDHGIKHIRNVQSILGRLMPIQMHSPLNSMEYFVLLSSVLLHDVGMATKKTINESTSQTRIVHSDRSGEFVIKLADTLNLSEHEAIIIGEICQSHGMADLKYLDKKEYSINNNEIRIQFLSALLRLADILDITSDRAPTEILKNRKLSPESLRHWNVHRCISDVVIKPSPSWDISIVASLNFRENKNIEIELYELRNTIQKEVDILYDTLKGEGIYFKRVDLILNDHKDLSNPKKNKEARLLKNPFIQLSPFGPRNKMLFSGREIETHQLLQYVLSRKLVVLIGESGVGKTSLVEAGIKPILKKYGFVVINFSFQEDPIENLKNQIFSYLSKQNKAQKVPKNTDLLEVIRFLKKKRVIFIGDHLEQMFTIDPKESVRITFVEQMARILGNPDPITFLFCIREDYLPDLHTLSYDLPELYERQNIFRLHRLSLENSEKIFQRASEKSKIKLSKELIKRIVQDLYNEGDGNVYPPYLQIVGYKLYEDLNEKSEKGNLGSEILVSFYDNFDNVETIINNYLYQLFYYYTNEERPIVSEILGKMVTEHYTKKRVTLRFLKTSFPESKNLEKLLQSLIDRRIVRRSLGDYELIHDFLAKKIIDIIKKKRFFSPPVRKAMEYIEKNYYLPKLSTKEIAKHAEVTQSHLAVLFKRQLGNGINFVLNSKRIEEARYLLVQSRDPLTEIASKIGYQRLSIFSRKFKSVEGISPLEYRKISI